MILLALEVPVEYLEEFEPYQDFNYAIAPWLTNSEEYFNFFKNSELGRPWVDNGVNEYGHSQGLHALLDLAQNLNAVAVVPPDNPDDPERHVATLRYLENIEYSSVGCLLPTYEQYWNEIASLADIVALPYDAPFSRNILPHPYPKPIHLFGFRTLEELELLQGQVTSIDTGMPIKLASAGEEIEGFRRPYGGIAWRMYPDYINLALTEKQRALAHRNCVVLRLVCNGRTIKEAVREADSRSLWPP